MNMLNTHAFSKLSRPYDDELGQLISCMNIAV